MLVDAARPPSPCRWTASPRRRCVDPVFSLAAVRVRAARRGRGCRLTLKVRDVNPIRSFKGRRRLRGGKARRARRRAPVYARAPATSPGHGLCCPSAACDHGVRRAWRESAQAARMRALGAEAPDAGADLDEASRPAAWAAERSARFVEDGFEPHVRGAGSIALELLAARCVRCRGVRSATARCSWSWRAGSRPRQARDQ